MANCTGLENPRAHALHRFESCTHRYMFSIKSFLSDRFKQRLLEKIKKHSVCCEIGVWRGDFSEQILEVVKPKKLHLVDPWKFIPRYNDRWYGGAVADSQKDMDKIYKTARDKFAKDKRVSIYRQTSQKASDKFEDNYFDFIYIDGDHSYEEVLKDLRNYYPKLKKGEIVAGDDYFWKMRLGFPVMRAVKQFCKDNKLKFTLIGTQFLIVKK